MVKIKVANPVVELDGDEMARIVWRFIKEQLVLPYLDVELEYFDLGIQHRDATRDQVTADAAQAVRRHGAGVVCPTITPDEARVAEFGLRARYRPPHATLREAIGGGVFHEPVVLGGLPGQGRGRPGPVVVGRPAAGDQRRATDLRVPGPGTLTLTFTPVAGGGDPVELEVCAFEGPGAASARCRSDASVRDFARASFRYALARRHPVRLTTDDTALTKYDGRFRDLFLEVFDAEFAADFGAAGLTCEHRPAEELVAAALRGEGGFLWVCRNDGGDLRADAVVQGFGPAGPATSVLVSADGRTLAARPAHGTVTRHYRRHQQGRATSTNPVASVHAWTRALAHRAALDGTPEVTAFTRALEEVCAETVEGGQMTADLARLVSADQPSLTTEQFLETLDTGLQKKMASR
ncbi:NADP-dependent isocitrate dehydrogenase [Streptomyces sp. NRRL S-118]|uniref:NADP-dependent isocitrate dehydrogenase n=1 Tax=Streptomyces sp. NRRL S-118 TaxID=1463881 RepID=UPI0004C66B85|nr:NADP-dependent isocitrate dehydrogenase [Streptomyces sp. NRRL S-118]